MYIKNERESKPNKLFLNLKELFRTKILIPKVSIFE